MRHSKIADRGSEKMIFFLEREVTDRNGNTRKVFDKRDRLEIWVNVSTDRQSSAELPGQVDVKVVKAITRKLPRNAQSYSLVEFRGEMWDFAIPKTETRFTKATSHEEIMLRSRNETGGAS